jgi:endonuclease/exonuclease/phosphatase (EEP) superfamily protein YafD
VVVEVPAGRQLLIAPTTPWQPDAAAAREEQAVQVSQIDARHHGTLPTIIAGDLNARPEAASTRYLCGLQALDGHRPRGWPAGFEAASR